VFGSAGVVHLAGRVDESQVDPLFHLRTSKRGGGWRRRRRSMRHEREHERATHGTHARTRPSSPMSETALWYSMPCSPRPIPELSCGGGGGGGGGGRDVSGRGAS